MTRIGAPPGSTADRHAGGSSRVVRAAGVATTLAAGGLAMVMTAAHAVADADPPGLLQPVVDQLVQAEQQVDATDSGYSFIAASELSMVHQYTQNLALTMFGTLLGQTSAGDSHDVTVQYAPYLWEAPAADPQEFLVMPNPDDQYSPLTIDSAATYVVTVDPGPGTQDLSFAPESGNGVTTDYTNLAGGLDLSHATPNADGTYSIILSSTEPSGNSANWVDTAGADKVIVRDTLGNWALPHDNISVQELGVSATTSSPTLSDSQISSILSTLAASITTENASGTYFGTQNSLGTIADNTFTPIAETFKYHDGPLLAGQQSSLGHFSLEPGQALIVKAPDIQSAYSSIMIGNDFAQTAPYATVQGSLNDTQAFHDPSGFTYYVISSQDPGVANWIDDSGLSSGDVVLRWQGITGSIPTDSVTAEVVPIADVAKDLPADTPTVTAAQYAADFQERLFDYDYAHDQNTNLAWVGVNLLYDQVRNAVGTAQFDEIFGAQQDVPSVLDRLTPALSPDLLTLARDVLTNPAGSLTALVDNVPLAIKDVELPAILSVLELLDDVRLTVQAVHADITSGALPQVPSALAAGVQGLGTVVGDTFTDPTTSITAGILNARDDLAVSVMNAGGYTSLNESAPLWDSLLQVNQSLLATLVPASLPGDLGSVLAPLSGDLSALAAAPPLDLLP
ncbi:hypothetical protein [Mycobacterium sp.]|uniref:hypothetical protein n=1 Tax=Mycobacterium sp. TaxID=1785 RepID=UPI0031CE576C